MIERCRVKWILPVMVLALSSHALAAPPERPALKPGPQTTIIDGPLNEDGTVDYLTYFNQRFQAIPHEDNFFVDLAHSIHPERWPSEYVREQTYRLMNLDMPPDDSPLYFITLRQFLARKGLEDPEDDEYKQIMAAYYAGGEAHRHPVIGEWLDINEQALHAIAAAVHKPQSVSALTTFDSDEPQRIVYAILPSVAQAWMIHGAFAARIHRHLANNELDKAIVDLNIMMMLSRLVPQSVADISFWLKMRVAAWVLADLQEIIRHPHRSSPKLAGNEEGVDPVGGPTPTRSLPHDAESTTESADQPADRRVVRPRY